MAHSIVCVKICVDTNELRALPNTRAPDLERAPLKISSFDENAIEEAVRTKESHGGTVAAVTLAPVPPPREIVLKILAMGVDRAYVVRDRTCADAEPFAIARILAAAIRKIGAYDLVWCGEASSDQFNARVGPGIAVELGIPAVTYVTKLRLDRHRVVAERALEDYVETVEAACPVLVTVGGEINRPRLPPVLRIMSASAKPTVEWQVEECLGPPATAAPATAPMNLYAPPSHRKQIVVDGQSVTERAERLVKALAQDGVVKE